MKGITKGGVIYLMFASMLLKQHYVMGITYWMLRKCKEKRWHAEREREREGEERSEWML